jgi:hypothetical protein
MTKQEEHYIKIGTSIKGSEESQMFGKPCFKVNGKACMCFFNGDMVFKLADQVHAEALSLDGSKLFDPSGKGRAMKEWVQVSFDYKDQWAKFARAAFDYVKGSKK